MTKKEKLIKAGIILFLISLAAFFTYFVYLQILVARGDLIKYEGKWYRKDDWHELYGEYETPAKNTPEEVYENFRQALLADDIETALSLITPKNREEYRKAFEDNKRLEIYKKIPVTEKIINIEDESFGNYSNYYYEEVLNSGVNKTYSIDFIKNRAGYWEIDSI